jgi:hypothetical protein
MVGVKVPACRLAADAAKIHADFYIVAIAAGAHEINEGALYVNGTWCKAKGHANSAPSRLNLRLQIGNFFGSVSRVVVFAARACHILKLAIVEALAELF